MNKKIYAFMGYTILALLPIYFFNNQELIKTMNSRHNQEMKLFIDYMPYLSFGLIAFLGTRLNQTRVFFSSLFLLLVFHLRFFNSFDLFFELPSLSFYRASMVSLPLCFAAWLSCKESPLSGNKSLVRMFIGLSPLALMLVVCINDQGLFQSLVGLKKMSRFDSYIISYLVFLICALVTNDKKIIDYKVSSLFSLVPVGVFFYYNSISPQSRFTWGLCFSLSATIMLYSMFKMYWQRVYLDEMTSLPNRRALDEKIEALDSRYTIAMIDVDNFKKFNDTYGHDQGDDVLKLVARTLESVLGSKVYRYGGEEFAAVMRHLTLDESKVLVDRAREKLERTQFLVRSKTTKKEKKTSHKKVKVTISAGVSQVSKVANTPDKVIKIADNALYKAKKNGRNCVIAAA